MFALFIMFNKKILFSFNTSVWSQYKVGYISAQPEAVVKKDRVELLVVSYSALLGKIFS